MLTNLIIKIIIVHGLHGVWLYCLAMDKKHSRLFSALICAAMAFITAAPCIYCEVTGNDNMYYVICGTFKIKANAEKRIDVLKKAKVEAYIKEI